MLILLFCSCKKDDWTYKRYEVNKGDHFSGIHYSLLSSSKLIFDAMFDGSCEYNLGNSHQLDINKLYGVSDCNGAHHENSARFGWRWNGIIEIFAYWYNDGILKYELIGTCNVNEVHRYEIDLLDKHYLFKYDSKELLTDRFNQCNLGAYYKLFFYFGGQEVAPHDMIAYIKEL